MQCIITTYLKLENKHRSVSIEQIVSFGFER
jgi:hypothetical protein